MSPARRLLIGAVVLVTGAMGFAIGRSLFRPADRVVQPVAFNHQKHVGELGMECDYCHQFYQVGEHSGLPTLTLCMECHEEALTDDPEEQRLLELAASGEDDVFRKLFRIPDHTFYSHRRHVTIAQIECETCHGDIGATTSPPEIPFVRITMDLCIECHDRFEVSDDCTRCHR